ncbi:endonuclease/exonuclease/phosphatase family protein [Streptomyces sp. SDr-06]|uniref:endonuclease/exonuclease/phosphatase family protein n=1 Tax=Streptomyces sp. SDr-06 TaxID=2267702 RepID=UPI000DE8253E|nr:endonuclease/exonuclease/phosphatase family protein [Streptomyces sp. SDr-06]RCH66179.1 endonuclease [Streptomyces sp. SDr-06]
MSLDSAVAVCALVWGAFLGAHLALNGRWWPWLAVSLLPPPLFAAVPTALLAAAALTGSAPAGVLATGCLVGGLGQSGVNFHALRPGSPVAASPDGVRVVSWNTQHWNQGRDPDRFYAFLHTLPADVYLLQEYLNGFEGGEVWDIDDEERLRREFPGHHLAIGNNSVTLSRFPLAGPPVPVGACSLRVDLSMPGGVVSTYNVHIPVQLTVMNPLSRAFFRDMRRRHGARLREYDALVADLAANPHPFLVSGDFNTSAAIGDIRRMPRSARDAIGANRSLFPASWNARRKPRLWRIDWVFTSAGLHTEQYAFRDPGGLSDHLAQDVTITTTDIEEMNR